MAYNVVVSFLDGVIANKYRTDAGISGVTQLLSGKILSVLKHFAKWTLFKESRVSYILLDKLMINSCGCSSTQHSTYWPVFSTAHVFTKGQTV